MVMSAACSLLTSCPVQGAITLRPTVAPKPEQDLGQVQEQSIPTTIWSSILVLAQISGLFFYFFFPFYKDIYFLYIFSKMMAVLAAFTNATEECMQMPWMRRVFSLSPSGPINVDL